MQDLLNKIDRLLKEKKFFEVKNIVKDENAADLAVLFDELFGEVFGEKTEFMILFRLLPKDLAAETFAHMNSDMQSHLIHMTVSEAFEKIRKVGVNKETIYTCYVTENRKLIGVITVKDLFMADEDDKIADIMETHIISVDTLEDKEIVGHMFRKYDFLALPVVDKDNRLVGIVTFDDAMDVIQDENTEDFSKMAAIAPNEESYFRTGIFKHAKSRIVWLLILMISATITQIITNRYEAAFAAVPLLVSFMPMIMDTGGNCGAQSSTLIIRGIALDEIHFSDFFKVVFKEFRISIIVSSVLAVVNGVRIYIMYQHKCDYPFMLALTIALSIIATVILSKVIGSMLPMLAKKCRLDPAIMATPLITTIVDCCSLFLYFNIATIVFSHIGIL